MIAVAISTWSAIPDGDGILLINPVRDAIFSAGADIPHGFVYGSLDPETNVPSINRCLAWAIAGPVALGQMAALSGVSIIPFKGYLRSVPSDYNRADKKTLISFLTSRGVPSEVWKDAKHNASLIARLIQYINPGINIPSGFIKKYVDEQFYEAS